MLPFPFPKMHWHEKPLAYACKKFLCYHLSKPPTSRLLHQERTLKHLGEDIQAPGRRHSGTWERTLRRLGEDTQVLVGGRAHLWLIDHPTFLSNEVYIDGDSYSGIPIPIIVQEISQANEKGVQPWINLQGYVLGNVVTIGREFNYRIPCSHGMALISDELYEALSGMNGAYILDPLCEWMDTEISWRRSLMKKYSSTNFLNPRLKLPSLNCQSYVYFLYGFWANDDSVRTALHIRQGSIGKCRHCKFDIPYKKDIPRSFEYHVNLSRMGYRSLIYSGDHDLMVPFLATQAWVKSLNYSIMDDWRQWHTNGQVAGVEAIQLQSTNLKNVLPCSVDGYLRGLFIIERNNLDPAAAPFAKNPRNLEGLTEGASIIEVVKKIKPHVLLGLSGVDSTQVLKAMRESVSTKPPIFAMSNPTMNECTTIDAFKHAGEI
ncbi:serine carboxypeptidase-like 8 [Vigna unguiculata]|uniref:Serine carboxypeptidase-like 8 n=1 Tax=Vigna unguiculata TaxID=3917 RepID=A0A4D6N9F3_VIGUN|nr:serine carboxypeptidase-like 8 [Vigna unguiculata]